MDDRLQLIECQKEAETWLTEQLARPVWDDPARRKLEELAQWRAERAQALEKATQIDAAQEWDRESERIILEQDVMSGLIKGLIDGFAQAIRGQPPE